MFSSSGFPFRHPVKKLLDIPLPLPHPPPPPQLGLLPLDRVGFLLLLLLRSCVPLTSEADPNGASLHIPHPEEQEEEEEEVSVRITLIECLIFGRRPLRSLRASLPPLYAEGKGNLLQIPR